MKPTDDGLEAMAHTTGPWKVDSGEALKVRNNSGSIATVMQTHLTGRRSNDETMANARLIAAAPEMLEALHNMAELARPYMRDDVQLQALQDARAAITKATGEKP